MLKSNESNNLLGIYCYFGFYLPFNERIKLIKEAGFDSTMLWWGKEAFDDVDKSSAVKIVRDNGLYIENIHVPYQHCNNLWSKNDEVRKSIVKEHIKWIEDCKRFNIPIMVMHISEGTNLREGNQEGLKSFRELVKAAEENNIIIAIENTRIEKLIDYVFLNIKSKHLKLCYDTSHSWLCSENREEFINKYGSKIVSVHLSDNNGIEDKHWLPEHGIIDWIWIGNVLKQHNFKGCISLEVFPENHKKNPKEFLRKAKEVAIKIRSLL